MTYTDQSSRKLRHRFVEADILEDLDPGDEDGNASKILKINSLKTFLFSITEAVTK